MQLTVFAEDFEQERQDRALAQAARDTAKKTCETLARQVQQLDSQVKHLQRQVSKVFRTIFFFFDTLCDMFTYFTGVCFKRFVIGPKLRIGPCK